MSSSGLLAGVAGTVRPEHACAVPISPPGAVLVVQEPVSYSAAWDLQLRLHAERVQGTRPDTVLILEHQPVYTLGRGTRPSHWGGDERTLREHGVECQPVNRGGSVTYHGPGQIVAYPIVKLARFATGPRRFVHLLEDVIIRVLRTRNIVGHRISKKPGVWTYAPDDRKIACIGLRVQQGVTLHGLSLNVDLDLRPFSRIVPCGLTGCQVTSMAEILNRPVPVEPVKEQMARSFSELFAADWSQLAGSPEGGSDSRNHTAPAFVGL